MTDDTPALKACPDKARELAQFLRNHHIYCTAQDGRFNEAADMIEALSAVPQEDQVERLREALRQIQLGADRGLKMFAERQGKRKSPIWYSVNVLQDNLAACYGTALAALIKIDDGAALAPPVGDGE